MELKQVKALLHQTECGEMFMDGMGCSEPILTQGNAGLIDNFFVYLVDKPAGTASGPLARMGPKAVRCHTSYPPTSIRFPFPPAARSMYLPRWPQVRTMKTILHCMQKSESSCLSRIAQILNVQYFRTI